MDRVGRPDVKISEYLFLLFILSKSIYFVFIWFDYTVEAKSFARLPVYCSVQTVEPLL